MKRSLAFAVALFPLLCWAQPDTLWTRVIDTPYRDEARAVVETDDGGFMVAGLYEPGGWVTDLIHLVRFTATGDTLFTRIVGVEPQGWVEAMVGDGTGGFYVACGYGEYLVRINAAGDTLWSRNVTEIVPGENHGLTFSGPRCLASTTDTGCVLSGYYSVNIQGTPCRFNQFEKRSAIGDVVWHREPIYAKGGIQRLANGDYLCLECNRFDFGVTRLNSACDILWTRHHVIAASALYAEAVDIATTSDGGYSFIYEPDAPTAGRYVCLTRVDASGSILWTRQYGNFWGGMATRCLFPAADDGFVIVGEYHYAGNTSDFYVLRTNAAGDSLWSWTGGTTGVDVLCDAHLTSDGGLVLAGYSTSNPGMYIVRLGTLPATVNEGVIVPNAISLGNFPNPFNTSTEIAFNVPKAGNVTLKVYDLLGQEVTTLHQGIMSAGGHQLSFDGKGLPSGIYLCRLESSDKQATRKLVLLR